MKTPYAPLLGAAVLAVGLLAVLNTNGSGVAMTRLAALDGGDTPTNNDTPDVDTPTPDDTPTTSTTTSNFLSDDARSIATSIATDRGMEDLVETLPGANFENSFATFSGYLDVSDTKQTFYWFVMAREDALNKPVVLWTNGGPGCSGLIGFFTEQGPFRATEDMTVEPFDFAWNKEANILFIESPTGVGFSTSSEDADFDAGDMSTATDNFELLKLFFDRYPGMQASDLYLSGESYGGHYVPTLALKLVGAREEGNTTDSGYKVATRLKGIIVGNPYTDPIENAHGMYGAYFGRSMVPAKMYQAWFQECGSHSEMRYYALNYSNWPNSITGDVDCAELTAAMFDSVGDIDYYGLDFPLCNKAQGVETYSKQASRLLDNLQYSRTGRRDARLLSERRLASADASAPAKFGYDACVADYMTNYLNKAEVKAAIHANASLEWAECSLPDTLRYNYDDMNNFMEPVWKKLIEAELHLLVFSGDDDSICGPIGTQDWLARLADTMGLSSENDAWAPWYYVDPEYGDGQVGGYRVKYQDASSPKRGITFATVHHAGHEVPMYQPMKGLHVFKNYINGTW